MTYKMLEIETEPVNKYGFYVKRHLKSMYEEDDKVDKECLNGNLGFYYHPDTVSDKEAFERLLNAMIDYRVNLIKEIEFVVGGLKVLLNKGYQVKQGD